MAVLTHVADDFWQTTTKITVDSRGGGRLIRRVENACHVNFPHGVAVADCRAESMNWVLDTTETSSRTCI